MIYIQHLIKTPLLNYMRVLTTNITTFSYQVPQTSQSAQTPMSSQLTSILKPVPDQEDDIPPHPQNYASYYNTVESLQNNSIPDSTIGSTVEAPPQLLYSSGNDFASRESFAYDNSAYAPSNQPHYNANLGMDTYLGYNGNIVGPYNMEYDELVNAPPNSSGGNVDDIDAWFEWLLYMPVSASI